MKANEQLKKLLAEKQEALRRQQAQNPANKRTAKQNRWQRSTRSGWDNRQGYLYTQVRRGCVQ